MKNLFDLYLYLYIYLSIPISISSIREFLCSEAMHYLSIPTVRCASCVTSGSKVDRDLHYDGNVIKEKCTIVSRTASNFFRFGSFELFQSSESQGGRVGPSAGNEVLKKKLLDHILIYYLEEMDQTVAKTNTALYSQWIKDQVPTRSTNTNNTSNGYNHNNPNNNGNASKATRRDENSSPTSSNSNSNSNLF